MPDSRLSREASDQVIDSCLQQSANCAQTVFSALQTGLAIHDKDVVNALGIYPCGTTTPGGTCGAVVGAILALGLARGTGGGGASDLRSRYDGLVMVRRYCTRVAKELGGITCREIIKADLKEWGQTLDSFPQWRRHHLESLKRCTMVIKTCTCIAADMLAG